MCSWVQGRSSAVAVGCAVLCCYVRYVHYVLAVLQANASGSLVSHACPLRRLTTLKMMITEMLVERL